MQVSLFLRTKVLLLSLIPNILYLKLNRYYPNTDFIILFGDKVLIGRKKDFLLFRIKNRLNYFVLPSACTIFAT